MKHGPIAVSAEELGIFLSCSEPTLAYNLPLLLPLGKDGSFEKAKDAIAKIFAKHPYLDCQMHMES